MSIAENFNQLHLNENELKPIDDDEDNNDNAEREREKRTENQSLSPVEKKYCVNCRNAQIYIVMSMGNE